MSQTRLSAEAVRRILADARRTRIIVVGDVMLDHFIWGTVARISPEAPVPVVELERESFMPGGAANVARNLTSMDVPTELCGVVGRDQAGRQLKGLLRQYHIDFTGVLAQEGRTTSVKTRIVAHKQQVVRLDRETREGLDAAPDAASGRPVAPQDCRRRRRHHRRLRQGRGHAAAAGRD